MLVQQFLQEMPAFSQNLPEHGERFATFIGAHPLAQTHPYLADLARLEWMWHSATDIPPAQKLDFLKLAKCYPSENERIIFTLPANCFLLNSSYPLHQMIHNHPTQSLSISAGKQPFYFLVWRNRGDIHIDTLREEEWQILHWMRSGHTITHISTQLKTSYPHISISALLPQFVQKSWITGFTLKMVSQLSTTHKTV